MADENDERPRSVSVSDHSDKSVRHAWIALLVYAAVRGLSALVGALQQPAMVTWFMIDFAVMGVVLGLLAFGIYKQSRVAVVLAIIYVVRHAAVRVGCAPVGHRHVCIDHRHWISAAGSKTDLRAAPRATRGRGSGGT